MSKCTFIVVLPPLIIPFPTLPSIPLPDYFISFTLPSFSCPLD